MPINPQIPLGGETPPRQSMVARMGDFLKLRNEQADEAQRRDNNASLMRERDAQTAASNAKLAAASALDSATSKTLVKRPDGTSTFDFDRLAGELAGTPAASEWATVREQYSKADKAAMDLRESKLKTAALENDHIGAVAATVEAADNDPSVLLSLVAQGVANGVIERDHGTAIIQGVMGQDPTKPPTRAAVAAIVKQMKASSKEQRQEGEQQREHRATEANQTVDNNRQDAAERSQAADRVARLSLAKQEFEWKKTHGGDAPESSSWREYSAWLQEWHKVHAVNADNPESVAAYVPAPSFSDWQAAGGRIDPRSGKRLPADSMGRPNATAQPGDIELKTGSTRVQVTNPLTGERFWAPDQKSADAALKAWNAQAKPKK